MKQTKGLKRNTIDKYYTKPSVVELCIGLVKQHINIAENDLIIEPSAGDGSFIQGIKSLSSNSIFYDLEPEHPEIVKQDYLLGNYYDFQTQYKNIHIIGNPPFGRQSSLAIRFIKKSCDFCDTISFILPKSFKKDSMKKTFPLQFHNIVEIDLPEKSFLVDGIEYNVESVFQIWEKKEFNRETVEKIAPLHFTFVEKTNTPDISFRRVGVNAGKIDENVDKSIQSHYFIKFTNGKSIDENMELLDGLVFNHNNTVGPRSISKPELIKEFNRLLI
jgi:predicted RNA methylase